MGKYVVSAVRTTVYEDVVEADSLEEAVAKVDMWVADYFTIRQQKFEIEVN